MDCNNWTSVAPKLRKFACPLRVTLPCAGIDGAGHALKAMGISFQGTNVYDLEEGYRAHLQKLMPGAELRLGKQEGDITMVPLEELERPVHAVFSGPPCPPWSSAGNRNGQLDERADVLVCAAHGRRPGRGGGAPVRHHRECGGHLPEGEGRL